MSVAYLANPGLVSAQLLSQEILKQILSCPVHNGGDQFVGYPSNGLRGEKKRMASVKAWYWIGLGVLALSVGSSSLGRCWMEKASAAIDQLQVRTMPYVAMAEMALGHTQAGYARVQASAARVEAHRAELEAMQAEMQARLQAQMARQEERVRERVSWAQHANFQNRSVFVDQATFSADNFQVPDVRVTSDSVSVNGHRHSVVCPRTRIKMVMPATPAPAISTVEDPI